MLIKRILLLVFMVCCALIINAQQTMPLYPDSIPNCHNCDNHESFGGNTNGRKFLKNVTLPTLTVFLPEKPATNRTAVIICPGGGYSSLSIEDGGFDAARELTKNGIVAIVLKYRTTGEKCISGYSIVPLQDVQQAIYQTRLNASKWQIDLHKVGLLGFSAGGHLSGMAATQYNSLQIDAKGISLRPDFTILAYPVISFTDALTSRNSKSRLNLLGKNPSEQQKCWYSPELNVTAATPPSFLVHASNDSTAKVENSIAYYQALHNFGISAKLMIYQRGGHGFALYNKEEDDYWLPYAVKWLKLNLFL
ncbi:MAG: alpha/beta hydrolase [Bacteroidota bacterium]|nr:alpha/beta hydrolase [Bacteroidota bacterium]